MIGVLLRLHGLSLRGRVVRSLRLLRQPKYLVGFLVGAAWLGVSFLRPAFRAHSAIAVGVPGGVGGDAAIPEVVHQMAALFVTFFLPLPWLLPWGPLGLPFREAELTMLLQAPVSRRQLIQYGLLKSEIGVVFGSLLVSLAYRGRGAAGWLAGLVATWLLFDLWHVNGKWRALFNLRQRELPAAVARVRRVAVTGGLLAFYALLCVAVVPLVATVAAALQGADPAHIAASLSGIEWPALLRALCSPAYWLTAPIFAAGSAAFLVACLPLVVVLLLQREVVLRSRARFEEVALEQARVRETRKAPGRRFARLSTRARSGRPFELGPLGQPALSILWKNLLRVSRLSWRSVVVGIPLMVLVVAAAPALLRVHEAIYGVALVLGMCFVFFPPLGAGMIWNNDLRTELSHLELLRTWPVSARALVIAEVASSALLSFVVAVLGAGLVFAGVFGSQLREALTGEATSLALLPRSGFLGASSLTATLLLLAGVLPVAAALSFFSSSVQNLVTLFMPAWMAHSADRSRGIAAMGQRMVSFSALALAVFLALIPGGLLVTAALLLQGLVGVPWSAWELPVWGVLAAAPMFLAALALVGLAARLWERLDPAQEILEIGR